MKEEEHQLSKTIALLVYRYGTTILIGIGAWAAMWVKVHAPTKEEFNVLVREVQGLREEMIKQVSYSRLLEDHEQRLRTMERNDSRRFPKP